MRRLGSLALVLAACSGAAGSTVADTTPRAHAATTPIVASEGTLNGPARLPVPAPTAPQASEPTSADQIVSLGPRFHPDPVIRRGTAGGPLPADQTFNPSCRGYVTRRPSYLLKLESPQAYLRVMVSMPGDATLVVQFADGRVLCNDDSEGLNPIVESAMPAGRHRVWVGAYHETGVGTPYTIAFTTQPSIFPSTIDGLPVTP